MDRVRRRAIWARTGALPPGISLVLILASGCSLDTLPRPFGAPIGDAAGDPAGSSGGSPGTGSGGRMASDGRDSPTPGGVDDGGPPPATPGPVDGGVGTLQDAAIPSASGPELSCDPLGSCPACPAGGCNFTCQGVNPIECRGQCPAGGCVQVCLPGPTPCALECPGGDTLLCPVCTGGIGCVYGCNGPRPAAAGCWGGN